MIVYSSDNEKIFRLLEESGNLPQGYDSDCVIVFDEDDLFLVLYAAAKRDFHLFTAQSFLFECAVLDELLETLRESKIPVPPTLLEEAMLIIEDKIRAQNSRFYFDAH